MTKELKVAIVHEWWSRFGGSEDVVMQISRMYPNADVWVLYIDKNARDRIIQNKKIRQSWLRWVPFHENRLISALLSPLVYRTLSLKRYDLVISSSHTFAHMVHFFRSRNTTYLSYVYTPARSLWLPEIDSRASVLGTNHVMRFARFFDARKTKQIEAIASISTEVQSRILNFWNSESTIIYPPVNLEEIFALSFVKNEELHFEGRKYLVSAGRFVKYKNHELSILIAKQMNLPILLMGSGPLENDLKGYAIKNKVEHKILISPDRRTWLTSLANAEAMIFPGIEDFGITPIESIAVGTPVFAYGYGGATDYIQNGVNGALIMSNNPDNYASAIENFEKDVEKMRESIRKFSTRDFEEKFKVWVHASYPQIL